jgi:hypothetical protein
MVEARRIAAYAAMAIAGLVGVTLIARPLVQHAERLSSDVATTTRRLTVEPESVMDAAVQERYRLRRRAVAAMRQDLLRIVALEDRFHADSGNFTPYVPRPGYRIELTSGNVFGAVHLTPHGWWTTITNVHVAIFCAVVVGPDTSIGQAAPGQPVCLGEHARFPNP